MILLSSLFDLVFGAIIIVKLGTSIEPTRDRCKLGLSGPWKTSHLSDLTGATIQRASLSRCINELHLPIGPHQ